MADFKRGGAKTFGGASRKPSFGARSGKPSYAKKPWESRSSDGPMTHYKATCSNCGDQCEVPFKPVNGKPVFCRKCFVKTEDTGRGRASDRFQKREYSPRAFPATSPESPKNSNDAVVRHLEAMNAKLERLIQVVETMAKK